MSCLSQEDPCSDIDFLVSHAEVGRERGAVEELLSRLKKKGLVISFLNPGKILPNFKNGQCDKVSCCCSFFLKVVIRLIAGFLVGKHAVSARA